MGICGGGETDETRCDDSHGVSEPGGERKKEAVSLNEGSKRIGRRYLHRPTT